MASSVSAAASIVNTAAEWMSRSASPEAQAISAGARKPNDDDGDASSATMVKGPVGQPTCRLRQPRVPGADLHFVRGDVRPVHAAMRAASGGANLWIVGGGDLAGQFHDAGLLDEVIVQVGSVTLGAGKPLFPRRVTGPPLELLSARPLGPGFAELRYRVPVNRAT